VLETPHVAVGAAIATKVVHPALAIPLAFGSHLLLEKVPHWNPHLNTEVKKYGKVTKNSTLIVAIDATLALLLGGFIAFKAPTINHSVTILAASLASVLPDLIEAPYFFLRYETKFIRKWIIFQKSLQADTTIIPGLITQVITIIAALMWIF